MRTKKARRLCPSATRSKRRSPSSPTKKRSEFLADLGMEEPGLNRVIRAGYVLLGLHNFFTAGPRKSGRGPRALAPKRRKRRVSSTPISRKVLFARKSSRYEDFIACGGEQGAKDAGKWRLEGKDYVVQDGDVMLFRFNV